MDEKWTADEIAINEANILIEELQEEIERYNKIIVELKEEVLNLKSINSKLNGELDFVFAVADHDLENGNEAIKEIWDFLTEEGE